MIDREALIAEIRRRQQQRAIDEAWSNLRFTDSPNFLKRAASTVLRPAKSAIGGLDDFTRAVDEMPVERVLAVPAIRRALQGKQPFWFDADKEDLLAPSLKLGTPKRVATQNIRTLTDEAEEAARRTPLIGSGLGTGVRLGGRGTEGIASLLLDPTNLMGIGAARKVRVAGAAASRPRKLLDVAAEIFGRGTQSKADYLKTLGAVGAGSGIGGEIGGTPGSLIGGFGGGWGGMSALNRSRRLSETAKIEASRLNESTRNLRGLGEEAAEGIRRAEDRFPRFKAANGKEYSMLEDQALSRQIADRMARLKSPTGGGFPDESTRSSFAETTDALSSVLEYMRESGSARLPVADPYDFGRSFRAAKEGDSTSMRQFAEMEQAAQRNLDLENASAGRFGDYRYVEERRGKAADLLGSPAPETETALATWRDFDAQSRLNREGEAGARKAVSEAKLARKARQDEILNQFPEGSRTAAKKYISALITGKDIESTYGALQKRVKGMDLTGLTEDAASFIDLHRATGEAETGLKNLLGSRAELDTNAKTAAQAADEAVKRQFGQSVKSLQGKLLAIPGQGGRYRVKGFGVAGKEPALDLEYVPPSKSIEESIGAGLDAKNEAALALKEARSRVKELRVEQAKLRKSGADAGDIADRIKAAEAEARSLELVRPISGPRPPGRQLVPLSDAREFIVYKPGKTATPAALQAAGIKDARTIKLLNDESRFRTRVNTARRSLEALDIERQSLLQKSDPASMERLAQVEENIAGLQSDLAVSEAELANIDASIQNSQQALEATLSSAAEEAANARRLFEEGIAVRDEGWKKFYETLELSPEDAAARFARNSEEINKSIFAGIEKEVSGKRMTQGAYDEMTARLDEYAVRSRAALSKPAQEALGQFANNFERQVFRASDRNAISRLIADKNNLQNIDQDAWRNGLGGWFRHDVFGTGTRNPETESTLASIYTGESAASQIADMDYGGMERNAARLTDNHLQKVAAGTDDQAAWAREVQAIKDPLERTSAVLRNAAKPITDHSWRSRFDAAQVPEEMRQQIYDLYSGNFLVATRNFDLFDKMKLDPSFHSALGLYGGAMKSIEQLGKTKGLMRNLLKEDFREYAPQGRILQPDGSIKSLKPAERNDISDLYEIMQNAANDPKRAARSATMGAESMPQLADMMIPSREWGVVQAGNILNQINKNAAWDKVSTWLVDPKAVEILKRGGQLQSFEWKNPAFAEDFQKIYEALAPVPRAKSWMGQKAEQLVSAMNKTAASTITGDASFSMVQGLIGAATSPAMVARMLTTYKRHAFTDEGFRILMADPVFENKLIDRVNRGMSIGRAGITGQESVGNLWQEIPGLRKIGNGMAALDKIAFDRMQLMNKMNAIDTMEADVQMIRAFGKEVGGQFVDGIPTLARLNQEANLYQSTPEEISNAIIRLANNQLGGLSKSQSLLGRNRQTLESTLLFVPGFFRARGGLINSVSKMLRNPDSPEGYLAASLLAREALFRMAFAAGIAELTGTSDNFREEMDSWAALDPRKSGGILTGPLGESGGYLGLSWGNAAPKLYAQMLAGNSKGEFNLNPQDRLKAATDFFEGRTNPVIGMAIDQLKGEDFMGRPVQTPRDRVTNALQAVMPMFAANTASEANEALHTGRFDPATLAATTAAEFIGLNPRASVPSQVLNNRFKAWQEENFPGEPVTDWRDAPSKFKLMAREDKGIADAEEDYTSDLGRRVSESASQRDIVYRAWDERNTAFDTEIAKASQQLTAGRISPEDFKATYSSLQEDRADLAADMQAVLAKAGLQKRDEVGELGGRGPQLAQLMAEYNAVKPQSLSKRQVTDGGIIPDNDIDWSRFKQERAAVLAQYPAEVRAAFEETQVPEDPNVQKLQRSREVLDTYFDQMSKYRGLSNVEGKTLDAYKSVLNASAAQYGDLGVKVDRQTIFLQTLRQMEQRGQINNPRQAQIATLAMKAALDSKFSASLRNIGAIQFLLNNPDAFLWYPWLEAEIPSQLRRLVPQGNLDTNRILERELRGSQLSSVR